MSTKRYIDVAGVVEMPAKYSFNQAVDEFLKFIEAKGCTFGGGFVELDEDGNQIEN